MRFEESDDGIYRWRQNITEEKRPEINDAWRPLPYDYLSGTFCSPSMKIPGPGADRFRPLPNKLCAWLRGRNVRKLVSIKHSIEQTPPYYFLHEEEQEETDEKVSVVMVTYLYGTKPCRARSTIGDQPKEEALERNITRGRSTFSATPSPRRPWCR